MFILFRKYSLQTLKCYKGNSYSIYWRLHNVRKEQHVSARKESRMFIKILLNARKAFRDFKMKGSENSMDKYLYTTSSVFKGNKTSQYLYNVTNHTKLPIYYV